MSADQEGRESFFTRWSRVKTERHEAPPAPSVPLAPDVAATSKAEAESPAPALPPVDELTIDSDFSGFFHPKVDEDVRRSALRKLFSDPHFNVMDGLDVYIDDYSKSEPIPAAMLASMKQAQRILEWAAETEEEAQVRRSGLPVREWETAPEATLPAALPEAASEIPEMPVSETDINAHSQSEPAAQPIPKT